MRRYFPHWISEIVTDKMKDCFSHGDNWRAAWAEIALRRLNSRWAGLKMGDAAGREMARTEGVMDQTTATVQTDNQNCEGAREQQNPLHDLTKEFHSFCCLRERIQSWVCLLSGKSWFVWQICLLLQRYCVYPLLHTFFFSVVWPQSVGYYCIS